MSLRLVGWGLCVAALLVAGALPLLAISALAADPRSAGVDAGSSDAGATAPVDAMESEPPSARAERQAAGDEGVVLSEAIYANQEEALTHRGTPAGEPSSADAGTTGLRDLSGTPRAHCDGEELTCPAGNFCAWGTKPKSSHRRVGVFLEGRLVATEGDTTNPDERAVRRACTAYGEAARVVWFVSVPSAEIPVGSIVQAREVDAGELVLKEGTFARTSVFAIDGNFVTRSGSLNGPFGTGFGVASMTRSVGRREITAGPQPDNVSPWSFGIRYEATLFRGDWMHRLSIIAQDDFRLSPRWTLTPGLLLGGGVAFGTSGGSSLTAGLLLGGSAHLAAQVTPQITGLIGWESEALVSNGTSFWLNTVYGGPQVSF